MNNIWETISFRAMYALALEFGTMPTQKPDLDRTVCKWHAISRVAYRVAMKIWDETPPALRAALYKE